LKIGGAAVAGEAVKAGNIDGTSEAAVAAESAVREFLNSPKNGSFRLYDIGCRNLAPAATRLTSIAPGNNATSQTQPGDNGQQALNSSAAKQSTTTPSA